MKPHSVKFNNSDWETMQALSQKLGYKSVGQLINQACREFVEHHGEAYFGGATWGSEPGSNRGRWKRKAE